MLQKGCRSLRLWWCRVTKDWGGACAAAREGGGSLRVVVPCDCAQGCTAARSRPAHPGTHPHPAAADPLYFHPLTNEASTALSGADLLAFLASTGHAPTVIDFAAPA